MRGFLNLSPTLRVSALNLDRLERQPTTGLILLSSSRTDSDVDRLGRRQPDWILVSKEHNCRFVSPLRHTPDPIISCSHTKAAGMSTSGGRLALLHLVRWVVNVFPLVLGFLGMIDSSRVVSLLKFLDIQRKHWQVAIEQTASTGILLSPQGVF
jgi:hypothetical protein